MKRSEMVKSIASELIHSWLDTYGIEGLPDFKGAQNIAYLLLERIEREGMLPPDINKTCFCSTRNSCSKCDKSYYYYNK